MNTVTDDLIRAFLADEARRAVAAAPSLDQAVGRLAPRIAGRPSGASQRLTILLAATLLLAAALGTAIAVGNGILRLRPEEPSVDLGIFEPVAGRIVYGDGQRIWGVDPAGSADPAGRVPLTSDPGTPLGWSRDGTRLLIMRGSSGERVGAVPAWHLFVLHADGSETQVTERPMANLGGTISPDGSRVVFAGQTETPEGECCTPGALYAVDADGGPAEMLREGDGVVVRPTFSPDGTRIAYADGSGDHSNSVWLMDADGSDAYQIVSNEWTEAAGHVDGLAWSPAGDRIALGLGGTLYTFATDGTDFMRIAGGGTTCDSEESCGVVLPGGVTSPYWSPDGSEVAFTTGCVDGAGAASRNGCMLAIADADGSNVREFGFGASGPWHPAGGTQSDEEADQPTPTELVLHFQSWSTGDDGATRTAVAIYADGRVIWNADEQADYVELQLTPEGIEQLRSRVMSTGLFEHDLALGLDLDTGTMEVVRGVQSVKVAWGRSRANLSGMDLQDRFIEATPAQVGELTELEAFFRDPAAWALPREMYRQAEITPFVPTHLVVGFDRAAPDWSTLPSPAREVVTRHLEPALRGQCDISIDQAREVLDALVQAEVIAAVDDVRLGFTFELGRSFVHLHQALPPVADCP